MVVDNSPQMWMAARHVAVSPTSSQRIRAQLIVT